MNTAPHGIATPGASAARECVVTAAVPERISATPVRELRSLLQRAAARDVGNTDVVIGHGGAGEEPLPTQHPQDRMIAVGASAARECVVTAAVPERISATPVRELRSLLRGAANEDRAFFNVVIPAQAGIHAAAGATPHERARDDHREQS